MKKLTCMTKRNGRFWEANEIRWQMYQESARDGFVVALRYGAIVDGNTTEICKALHGAVYAANNKIWERYRPPNHKNCRSLLVPIFITDNWDGIESPLPTVQPAPDFSS